MKERLATGNATLNGVLMAETERVRLEQEIVQMEAGIAKAETRMNFLRSHQLDTKIIPVLDGVVDAVSVAIGDAQEKALEHAPELQVAKASKLAAEAKISLARKDWYPDPVLAMTLRTMTGSSRTIDGYDTGVQFSIPWVQSGKYSAQVREAKQAVRSAEYAHEAAKVKILAEVGEHFIALRSMRATLDAYKDQLLPLARKSVDAELLALRTGNGDVLSFLSALKTQKELQSSALAARVDYDKTASMLAVITSGHEGVR